MIERTQRRLRQTRFFYEHLFKARHQTEGDPEAFRFYFSAFIQAARSVTRTLSNEQAHREECSATVHRDERAAHILRPLQMRAPTWLSRLPSAIARMVFARPFVT
jgi:hypothetical protein